MSKRINVNPDHYKTAGRDRPNEAAAARQNRTVAKERGAKNRARDQWNAGRDRPNAVAAESQGRATKGASSPSAPRRDPRQKGKALLADRRKKK